jgi:hypothetical protein
MEFLEIVIQERGTGFSSGAGAERGHGERQCAKCDGADN